MMTADLLRRYLELPAHSRRELLRRAKTPQGSVNTASALIRQPDQLPAEWPMRYPASYGQEAQWFLWRLAPQSPAYHVPAYYDLAGPFRLEAMIQAAEGLIARHEMLRTTFADTDRGVVQVVHERLPFDVAMAGAPDRVTALTLAGQAADEPFDLRRGPLLRLRVWQYEPQRFLVLLMLHHIAVDERSSRIIERELGAGYRAALDGTQVALSPLPVQYGDYARWQRGHEWTSGLWYWRDRLSGATRTELPTDGARSQAITLAGATIEIEMSAADREALSALVTGLKVSRFTALTAIFGLLLSAYTAEPDVTFGTPVACRTAQTDDLIGFFLNSVALRLNVGRDTSFEDLVADAKEAVVGAYRHQTVPFQKVADAVNATPQALRNPLFDVMFLYLTADHTTDRSWLADDLVVEPVVIGQSTAHSYVAIAVVEHPDRSVLLFRYPVDAYREETVRGWGSAFGRLLQAAAKGKGQTVTQVLADAGFDSARVVGG